MITIPVLIQHNQKEIIGSMTINEKLLPQIPNYCFGLGYVADKMEKINNKLVVTKYRLLEVSVTPDLFYRQYLQNNE